MQQLALARWALWLGCALACSSTWAAKGSVERLGAPALQTGVVDRVDAAGGPIWISGVEYLPPRPTAGTAPVALPGERVEFSVEPDAGRPRIGQLRVKKP